MRYGSYLLWRDFFLNVLIGLIKSDCKTANAYLHTGRPDKFSMI
jgi:hypothetical protein